MTIWKFPLEVSDTQDIEMPSGAELLHVARQGASVCVWARVNPDAPRVMRRLQVAGTGHPGVSGSYVGTFMVAQDTLVFHVFDHGEAR